MEPELAEINIKKVPDIDLGAEVIRIHKLVTDILVVGLVNPEDIKNGNIRCQSVLYMIYWFNRLHNNHEEQTRIKENLIEYIGSSVKNPEKLASSLLSSKELKEPAKLYVEKLLMPVRTVDLVITRPESNDKKEKEVLCQQRTYYPYGLALPGGIIQDIDEDNNINVSPQVYAALRVAGEKVLNLGDKAKYERGIDVNGKACFIVSGNTNLPLIRLYIEDEDGYTYRENIKSVLRPSDPRHIVDTIAFKCELEGDVGENLVWVKKSTIMSPKSASGGFAFGHHREIVAHITSQTSLEKEKMAKEREFIRSIINDPLGLYEKLSKRFKDEGNLSKVSFPELFPVVDRILTEAFSDEINKLCEEYPILAGIRDKAVISLRQVCLKNRIFCPYLPTILAIADGVAFFDVIARQKKGFYDNIPKGSIVEHDPSKTPYASYHMYRYKYRFDEILTMLPDEIIIPTFEPLSATDLMYVRGVPIRFIGISTDFLYVDEFEQSPEEFFMHDCNHSWRMIKEDNLAETEYGKNKEQMLKESNAFIQEYLRHIKILKTDEEEERELKKLKKIILFEIVHEDARPFLKEVICKFIQQKEGSAVPFEVPHIDSATGYMDIIDTLDTGISTLSYVRNKLQHGFYDRIDSQLPQIVGVKYRTAAWIARAAYEMLVELNAVPEKHAELDKDGNVSYEWLLRRTCAVGPDNIHDTDQEDPLLATYGDGAEKLNEKRYQA